MIAVDIKVSAHNVPAEIERDIDKLTGQLANEVITQYQRITKETTKTGRAWRGKVFGRGARRLLGAVARGVGRRFGRHSAPGQPLGMMSGRTVENVSVRRMKSGTYRVRFGGWVGYWDFLVDTPRQRKTIIPAIEAAVQIVFNGSPA